MGEDRKSPDQKFPSVKFQLCPTEYHTWGCLVFILKFPLHGSPEGLPKWEPRARTGVYLEQSPFHAGTVDLLLNTRTGHVSPQNHVVFDETLSTVEHMSKVTVPLNWKNLIKEHSDIAIKENFTLAKDWHVN